MFPTLRTRLPIPRARWQVVDAISPIPAVASGGIFDGRGIAAALMLSAVGVNLGTRFIASKAAEAEAALSRAEEFR